MISFPPFSPFTKSWYPQSLSACSWCSSRSASIKQSRGKAAWLSQTLEKLCSSNRKLPPNFGITRKNRMGFTTWWSWEVKKIVSGNQLFELGHWTRNCGENWTYKNPIKEGAPTMSSFGKCCAMTMTWTPGPEPLLVPTWEPARWTPGSSESSL